MPRKPPPILVRIVIGSRLRALRESAAMGYDAVAMTRIASKSKLLRERGSQGITEVDLKALMQHLHTLITADCVDVRVVPFAAGPHQALKGPFNVLEFPSHDLPALAHVDTYYTGWYDTTEEVVDDFRRRWTGLKALSVPLEEFA